MVEGISTEIHGREMWHLFRVRDEKGKVRRYEVILFQ